MVAVSGESKPNKYKWISKVTLVISIITVAVKYLEVRTTPLFELVGDPSPLLIGSLALALAVSTIATISALANEYIDQYIADRTVPTPDIPNFGSGEPNIEALAVWTKFISNGIFSFITKIFPVIFSFFVVILCFREIVYTLSQIFTLGGR